MEQSMSDITQAAEQQALADSLENAPIVGEVVEEQQQQPSTEETTEQLETAEVEPQATEEEADDWLPTEQEKVFPQETLEKYGKRYGYTPEEIAADPRLQRTLHDKINTDIFLRASREAEQMQELEQEEPRQEPTPPQTTQQYLEQIQAKAQQYVNPEVAMAFTNQFLQAFGVKDPATPQMAMEVTKTMTTFGMNLMQSVLQNELQPLIENAFPQFGDMYYRASLANTWDSIRNSGDQFAELPAYGTKEFKTMTREVAKTIPGFEDLLQSASQSNGGKLNAPDARKFYGILASVAAKQKTTPAEVKQAVQTGKNQANKTAIRKDAANLGAGQSKGQIAQKATRDDFLSEGVEIYQREHGGL